MAKTHYIIPIFVPELACPNRCIFCNQYTITAKRVAPSPIDTDYMISKRLSQIPSTAQHIEVAFFEEILPELNSKRKLSIYK